MLVSLALHQPYFGTLDTSVKEMGQFNIHIPRMRIGIDVHILV